MIVYWALLGAGCLAAGAFFLIGVIVGALFVAGDKKRMARGESVFEPRRHYGPEGEM